jgi:hypothetical protein
MPLDFVQHLPCALAWKAAFMREITGGNEPFKQI